MSRKLNGIQTGAQRNRHGASAPAKFLTKRAIGHERIGLGTAATRCARHHSRTETEHRVRMLNATPNQLVARWRAHGLSSGDGVHCSAATDPEFAEVQAAVPRRRPGVTRSTVPHLSEADTSSRLRAKRPREARYG